MKKILMLFFCFITIFMVSCSEIVEIERNENADAWIEDLEILKERLPEQAIALAKSTSISISEWEEKVDILIKDINTKTMSDEEIKYSVDEILANIEDGHLSFHCGYDLNSKVLPIFVKVIDNKDFYVSTANKEYEKFLGTKLISINDVAVGDIANKLMDIIPHDNLEMVYTNIEICGFYEEQLNYIGVGKEVNIFKFEMSNGDIVESEIKSINFDEYNLVFIYDEYKNKPLRYDRPDNAFKEYWYKIDESNNVFYFQYNSCIDKSSPIGSLYSENLPYFEDFTTEMIDYMKANDDKFDTVVIDLRNNLGGHANLLHDYYIRDNLEYLQEKDIKILVGKQTFSAGIAAVNDLYEKLDIKSYGTETGGLVGGYSVRGTLFLKNTKSVIYHSKMIINPSHSVLLEMGFDEWNGFIPDVIVEDSDEDFRLGIDRVYETAVKDN